MMETLTVRQLIEALQAMPNPEAPVVGWAPGQYMALSAPATMQFGALPLGYVMLEVNVYGPGEFARFMRVGG